MLFQDTPVSRWSEALEIYGDPSVSKLGRYGKDYDEVIRASIGKTNTFLGRLNNKIQHLFSNRKRTDIFDIPGAKEDLSIDSFSLESFKTKYIQKEDLLLLQKTVEIHKKRASTSSSSVKQLIGDNIHNFVKAQESLINTREEFNSGKLPTSRSIAMLSEEINSTIQNINTFFEGISEKQLHASNASMLLSKIQNYSFIFTAADDIEKYRLSGEYEAILHVIEKLSLTGSFEGLDIFEKALMSVQNSLTNTVSSLKSQICSSNSMTFNPMHLHLIMKIDNSGNSVLDIIHTLESRIRESFQPFPENVTKSTIYNTFFNQIDLFSETFPYLFVLGQAFYESDSKCFFTFLPQIEKTIISLITDFQARIIDTLNLLTKRKIWQNEQTSNEKNDEPPHLRTLIDTPLLENQIQKRNISIPPLRAAIQRAHEMWKNIEDLHESNEFTLLSNKVLSRIKHAELSTQNWFRFAIIKMCKTYFKSSHPEISIFQFLSSIKETSSIFTPSDWTTVVTQPIFMLFDSIHEQIFSESSDNQILIVENLRCLSWILEDGLPNLTNAFKEDSQHEIIPSVAENIIVVGQELSKLLKGRLISSLNKEFYSEIEKSISSEWPFLVADGQVKNVVVDSWVVFIINRCVEIKCTWKNLFEEMKPQIIKGIAACFLAFINSLGSYGAVAKARIDLDLNLLLYAFRTKDVDDMVFENVWGNVMQLINSSEIETKEIKTAKNEQLEKMKKNLEQSIKALQVSQPEQSIIF